MVHARIMGNGRGGRAAHRVVQSQQYNESHSTLWDPFLGLRNHIWHWCSLVTEEDLRPAFSNDENSLWRNILFPGYPVKIQFLHQIELNEFLKVRKQHFQEVWNRQRLRNYERQIFRRYFQGFSFLLRITNPDPKHSAGARSPISAQLKSNTAATIYLRSENIWNSWWRRLEQHQASDSYRYRSLWWWYRLAALVHQLL